MAPLELVICLPILAAMMSLLFTMASVGLTKSSLSVEVRQAVWQERHALQTHVDLPVAADQVRLVGSLLGPDGRPLRGLVRYEREGRVPVFYPGYHGFPLLAMAHHSVLAGTWDAADLPFDIVGREHPPLGVGAHCRFGEIPDLPYRPERPAAPDIERLMGAFRGLPHFR